MLPVGRNFPLFGVLVSALAVLDGGLIALGFLVVRPVEPDPTQSVRDPVPHQIPLPRIVAPRAEPGDDDPVTARPLFFATRRPFVIPVQAIEVPAPPPPLPVADPEFVLDGILIAGADKRARLRSVGNTEGQWVDAGQSIEGWTISVISNAEVILEREGHKIQVDLYPGNGSTAMVEPRRRSASAERGSP